MFANHFLKSKLIYSLRTGKQLWWFFLILNHLFGHKIKWWTRGNTSKSYRHCWKWHYEVHLIMSCHLTVHCTMSYKLTTKENLVFWFLQQL